MVFLDCAHPAKILLCKCFWTLFGALAVEHLSSHPHSTEPRIALTPVFTSANAKKRALKSHSKLLSVCCCSYGRSLVCIHTNSSKFASSASSAFQPAQVWHEYVNSSSSTYSKEDLIIEIILNSLKYSLQGRIGGSLSSLDLDACPLKTSRENSLLLPHEIPRLHSKRHS